jgi:hypothetical protein
MAGSATVAVADHLRRRSPLRPSWSSYGREIHAFAPALEAIHMATSKKKSCRSKAEGGLSVLLRDHNDLERSRFCNASAVCASFCGFKICGRQVDLVGPIVDSHRLGAERRLNSLDDIIFSGR